MTHDMLAVVRRHDLLVCPGGAAGEQAGPMVAAHRRSPTRSHGRHGKPVAAHDFYLTIRSEPGAARYTVFAGLSGGDEMSGRVPSDFGG